MKKKSWFYYSFWFLSIAFVFLLLGSTWVAASKKYSGQTGIDAGEIENIRKITKLKAQNVDASADGTRLSSW
jgi:hypothetical protein